MARDDEVKQRLHFYHHGDAMLALNTSSKRNILLSFSQMCGLG